MGAKTSVRKYDVAVDEWMDDELLMQREATTVYRLNEP